MKFATWNINSLRVRLPQVLEWLADNPVDVLCLQELKLIDERVPVDALRDAGYHTVSAGQPTYNGVAILSREPVHDVVRNLPTYDDPQQRVITATVPSAWGDIRVINTYCPNGQEVGSDKYRYKLEWFAALREFVAEQLKTWPRLMVLGDFNVAPEDRDIHDPEKWREKILASTPEREALQALFDLGLHDSFRLFEQPERSFSWWDYRQLAFRRNAGLRIDHVLISDALKPHCVGCIIDKEPRRNEQPSDHAPVIMELG